MLCGIIMTYSQIEKICFKFPWSSNKLFDFLVDDDTQQNKQIFKTEIETFFSQHDMMHIPPGNEAYKFFYPLPNRPNKFYNLTSQVILKISQTSCHAVLETLFLAKNRPFGPINFLAPLQHSSQYSFLSLLLDIKKFCTHSLVKHHVVQDIFL